MNAIEVGLKCAAGDEQRLVDNINAFLATKQYRKLYKWPDKGGIRNIDDPDSDPQIEYTYGQFLKQAPRWYFDLTPNVDLRGKHRFPDFPECGWTLYFSRTGDEHNSEADRQLLDEFLQQLIQGSGFDGVTLHRYSQGDYRR